MTLRILVAHDAAIMRGRMRVLLEEGGFSVEVADDGWQAVVALDAHPDVLVLDAAITGVLAFQVIDRIRAQRLATRVLLVASVSNGSAYKRSPASLHGADDYLEQHLIEGSLCSKVASLAASAPAGDSTVAPPSDEPIDAPKTSPPRRR